ncbi:hypothetical protein ACIOJD_34105 [Streptomyces sp. NPDC088116]|uniref:hypothetical protein n=1 Tax=Streptomyces sp. NPDC088116 TaxID=3365825 RepID=UPI00381C4E7A
MGNFESEQEVSFEILAAGNEAKDWKAHSHNKEGDVQFREKSAERTTSDFQLITSFLALALALPTLPSAISTFTPEGLDSEAGAAIRVMILAVLLAFLPATTRALLREIRKTRSADTAIIHLNGDSGSVICNARSASVGTARITQTPQEAESPFT